MLEDDIGTEDQGVIAVDPVFKVKVDPVTLDPADIVGIPARIGRTVTQAIAGGDVVAGAVSNLIYGVLEIVKIAAIDVDLAAVNRVLVVETSAPDRGHAR